MTRAFHRIHHEGAPCYQQGVPSLTCEPVAHSRGTTTTGAIVSPHGPAEHARVATLIRLHNHAFWERAAEPKSPGRRENAHSVAASWQVRTIRAILSHMNSLPVGKPRKSYADHHVQATRGLTSPNRTGLTSRLTSEDGSTSTRNVVRPSLEVLRERRGRDARPENLVEDVRACIQPVAETCCLSPTCHAVVSWPKTGGRPSRFCSRACQERFDRERGRLLAEVSAIEAALPLASAPAERRYLANQLSRRTWLLERYPLPYKEQDRLLKLERETRR